MNALTTLRSIFFGAALAGTVFFSANSGATAQTALPTSIEGGTMMLADASAAYGEQKGLWSVDENMGEEAETLPQYPTALSAQGPQIASYLRTVTSTIATEEEEMLVRPTVRETTYDGGMRIEVSRTGGSGTCAGSTLAAPADDVTEEVVLVRPTVREITYDGGMMLVVSRSGGSGTCTGSTIGE